MSDEFQVTHQDLESYATQVGRAFDDVNEAISYVENSCSMSVLDSGPLSTLASIANGGHKEIVENVNDALKEMRNILSASEKELNKTSTYYRETDLQEAKRIDATYPDVKREGGHK